MLKALPLALIDLNTSNNRHGLIPFEIISKCLSAFLNLLFPVLSKQDRDVSEQFKTVTRYTIQELTYLDISCRDVKGIAFTS